MDAKEADQGQELEFRPEETEDEEEEEEQEEQEQEKEAIEPVRSAPLFTDLMDDEEEVVEEPEPGVVMIRNKDGTTKMAFSGDQDNVVKKMKENIKQKFKTSKLAEIVDFKVIKNPSRKK